MTKLLEPEDLSMLRHRFGRTIEIWIAYDVFLNRQIHIGQDKICIDERLAFQTTHTLNMVFYSFIYSLFDDSGVSFKKIAKPLLPNLTPLAREAYDIVIEAEDKIHSELAKIRNNIGFHQGNKKKRYSSGYNSYKDFHPSIPILIMHGLRVFFREASNVYESSENYANPVDDNISEEIMQVCRDMKQIIAEDGEENLASILIKLGERIKSSGNSSN